LGFAKGLKGRLWASPEAAGEKGRSGERESQMLTISSGSKFGTRARPILPFPVHRLGSSSSLRRLRRAGIISNRSATQKEFELIPSRPRHRAHDVRSAIYDWVARSRRTTRVANLRRRRVSSAHEISSSSSAARPRLSNRMTWRRWLGLTVVAILGARGAAVAALHNS
jgi:hypothetical protein